jgi:hypothetical protein
MGDSEELASGPNCYREKTSAIYKTISPGDIISPSEKWIFIHAGPCECEGKMAGLDCNEPGDDGR